MNDCPSHITEAFSCITHKRKILHVKRDISLLCLHLIVTRLRDIKKPKAKGLHCRSNHWCKLKFEMLSRFIVKTFKLFLFSSLNVDLIALYAHAGKALLYHLNIHVL